MKSARDIEVTKVPKGPLALIGLLVVYLLPIILTGTIMGLVPRLLNLELDFTSLPLYMVYAASCWVTFLVMWLLLWKQGLGLKDIGYRGRIDLSTVGIAALFFIAGLAVLAISGFALDYVGIRWASNLELELEITSAVDAALLVFTLFVTSPIIEDTFYRAYSITILERKLGNRWVAGLVSCFMFALVYLPSWGVGGFIQLFLWPSYQ